LRFLKYQILKISFKNKSKNKKAHIFDPQIEVKNGREGLFFLLLHSPLARDLNEQELIGRPGSLITSTIHDIRAVLMLCMMS
jgi:hypothetical protein